MLISIVIPVYNVEEWLDRCMESIVNQSYKDIEIILVDDGSTDNSLAICNEWEKKDNRIKVYHKSNEGLGPTRNFGLKKALGEYVAFIDSDDNVDADYIECFYNAALYSNADFVSGEYKVYDCINGEISYQPIDLDEGTYVTENEKQLVLNILNPSMWGKLFRKDFLLKNNIMQPAIKYEDQAVRPIYVLTAEKIVHIKKAGYNYTINRQGSIMAKTICWRDMYTGTKYYLDYLKKSGFLEKYYDILNINISLSLYEFKYIHICNINNCFNELYRKYFYLYIEKLKNIFYNKKKYIIFGAGNIGKSMFKYIYSEKIAYIADNNQEIVGKFLNGKEIIDFDTLKNIYKDYNIILSIGKRKPLFDVIRSFESNNITEYILFTDVIFMSEIEF